jgi:hypothetical protein
MKEGTRNLIIVIAIIYILLSLALGSFNPTQWNLQNRGGNVTPTGAVGMFDVHTKGYDTLDISSVLVENTAYDLHWYAYRGGWILLGKGDATIELTDVDGGYVFASVQQHSGQSYYVDWAETKAKNPRVESVSFEDPDGDGYKQMLFKVNMGNIPKPATGNPSLYFYPYLLAYEKPTLNQPSDITGIGGSLVTKYIEWYVYFANVKKGFAITKVELTVNTTDTTKVKLDSVAVPNLGSVTGDMFGTPLRGTNSLTWSYSFGSNLYNCNFIKYGSNTLNKFYFTTQIDCLLASGDVLQLDITIYGLTTTGTLTTLTDSVVLKYGT